MAEMDEGLVKYENKATICILVRVCYQEVPFLREGRTHFSKSCIILPILVRCFC